MSELAVKLLTESVVKKVVNKLSEKYGFKECEACLYLGVSNLRVKVMVNKEVNKRQIVLPWCGKINEDNCQGIRLNHGLYTQCQNKQDGTEREKGLCLTCSKQVEKNSNKQPTYGYVSDRMEQGKRYRDPKERRQQNMEM